MRWQPRRVRPQAHLIAIRDARYEGRPPARHWTEHRFETARFADPAELARHEIWLNAPLTREARQAFERTEPTFWAVRDPGDERPFALVVRPDPHLQAKAFQGTVGISTEEPEAVMTPYKSTLVVTLNFVFTCGGSTSVEALRWLIHARRDEPISGDETLDFWRRPKAPPVIPPEDAEFLQALTP